MRGNGLDVDGFIKREGSLSKVADVFAPVVRAARAQISEAFGRARLHSAYLYGSIPRGTAIPGRSDLDLLLALRHAPRPADRAAADAIEGTLGDSFEQISGAGVLLYSTATLLSDLERHDLGWFVACLCTLLLGDDLAEQLPRYRPTSLLARETNGDLAQALSIWHEQAARARTPAERAALSRRAARKLVRTGFTLVMPAWGGWTSDLDESAQAFACYYPQRAAQMQAAAGTASAPTADPAVLHILLSDLGPWLATEYTAVHGTKTPRT